jgi:hypothetical protein
MSIRGRREAWLRFCDQIGADFTKGRSGQSDRIIARFREWTIILDNLAVAAPGGAVAIYTRMRVPYVNRDGFHFRIYSRKFPYGVGKKLPGIRSVEIGDPEFDQHFVIKGNSEPKIRALFGSPGIRQLIQSQPSIDLEVRHDRDGIEPNLPDGIDQLYFHEGGIITDVERLRALYDLFTEILDHLCCIGSASYDAPDLALCGMPANESRILTDREMGGKISV